MKLWYSLSQISRVVAEKAFFGKEFSRFPTAASQSYPRRRAGRYHIHGNAYVQAVWVFHSAFTTIAALHDVASPASRNRPSGDSGPCCRQPSQQLGMRRSPCPAVLAGAQTGNCRPRGCSLQRVRHAGHVISAFVIRRFPEKAAQVLCCCHLSHNLSQAQGAAMTARWRTGGCGGK